MEIILRKEAKRLGLTYYYTGKPCKHGHIDKRQTSNGGCIICIGEYVKRHPEKRKETVKKWDRNNRDKKREKLKRWRRNNKEKAALLSKIWKQKNPDKIQANIRKRRAIRLGCKDRHFIADIKLLEINQNMCCYWCGSKLMKYHIDHIIPLSISKDDSPANICLSCKECNQSKGAKLPQEWSGADHKNGTLRLL